MHTYIYVQQVFCWLAYLGLRSSVNGVSTFSRKKTARATHCTTSLHEMHTVCQRLDLRARPSVCTCAVHRHSRRGGQSGSIYLLFSVRTLRLSGTVSLPCKGYDRWNHEHICKTYLRITTCASWRRVSNICRSRPSPQTLDLWVG